PTPNFLIGVFSQRVSDMAKWKARGINCLVSHEPEGGRVKKADWETAAAGHGLYFMDYPSPDDAELQNEAKQPFRVAFMQDDEPDLNRHTANAPGATDQGWTHPDVLAARYARCKAAAPNVPVFVNFAGPNITPLPYKGERHAGYIAAADWLGQDWYVKNRNADRYPISFVGDAIDRLAAWSATPAMPKGKPQIAIIECSDQKISPLGRAPTPDEVEETINLCVAKGVKGICYFPQKPPPGFVYDAMPPAIVERITRVNAALHQRFNAAPMPPDSSGPIHVPPANGPTAADVVQSMNVLSARLAAVGSQLDALLGSNWRATVEFRRAVP
ncbi:MAG TPA: hypothetical protein VEA69_08845, partial [Tepidisphaeraceae bacterium]|nr:hypothetical protein [Tepidisphaeraceae bacterium]